MSMRGETSGRARWHSERGQDIVEYGGALLLVAAIIAVLATIGLVGQVARAVGCSVTSAFGASGHGCSPAPTLSASAPGRGGSPSPSPSPTPTPGSPSAGSPGAAAGAGAPTPNPQPGAAPEWRWPASAGSHADQLPTSGERPYSPPKKGRGKPFRVKGGYEDEDGNIWEWAPTGGQHGGPHWDVQHKDGSHTNVAPDGTVIGEDNFPNKRRVPTPPPPPPETSGDGNTAKIVGGTAAVGGGAAVLWWLGKLASPVCGPAVVVCGIVF
jgi:Bacterial toxin 37